MLQIRKSNDRGYFDHGWLKTHHTFSFDQYRDPQFDNFSVLRVINEDVVAAGEGFPTHGHRDMEIVTYVISGAIEHQDTLGNKTVIHPGEIQKMTAGTGIKHSEFNPLPDIPLHLLQVWILPQKRNETPGYDQFAFDIKRAENNLLLIASPQPQSKGSFAIHLLQDVKIFVSKLQKDKALEYNLKPERKAWLQLISGELSVNDQNLSKGDGLAIQNVPSLKFSALTDSHFLFFDLP